VYYASDYEINDYKLTSHPTHNR